MTTTTSTPSATAFDLRFQSADGSIDSVLYVGPRDRAAQWLRESFGDATRLLATTPVRH